MHDLLYFKFKIYHRHVMPGWSVLEGKWSRTWPELSQKRCLIVVYCLFSAVWDVWDDDQCFCGWVSTVPEREEDSLYSTAVFHWVPSRHSLHNPGNKDHNYITIKLKSLFLHSCQGSNCNIFSQSFNFWRIYNTQ